MITYTIAVIVGSLRKDSFNRKLANALIKLAPRELVFHHVDIASLPLYNQDHDFNPLPAVKQLKSDVENAQGLIFVTPEYNRSMPGVLKNALDHGSRPFGKNSWAGKPTGIVGASPGAAGTALAQQHLRNVLAHLDAYVLGQPEVFMQVKEGYFDEQGNMSDKTRELLQKWLNKYVAWVKLHAADAALLGTGGRKP
ncbi:MAG: hypothetical protein RLZZ227_2777 [Pseudomonadota bacterium]|jgi:chromate reductase